MKPEAFTLKVFCECGFMLRMMPNRATECPECAQVLRVSVEIETAYPVR